MVDNTLSFVLHRLHPRFGASKLKRLRRSIHAVSEAPHMIFENLHPIIIHGALTLQLDRPVNEDWVQVLKNHMGSFGYSMNAPPQSFQFRGTEARVQAMEHEAQSIIDHFKQWLPQASTKLRHRLE